MTEEANMQNKVYSADIMVYATVYIKAPSAKAALTMAEGLNGLCLELPTNEEDEVPISGRRLDDPDLPVISLSPMMTIHGLGGDDHFEEAS